MSLRTDRIISGKDRLENEPHFPPPAGGDDEVQERRWLPKCLQNIDGKISVKEKEEMNIYDIDNVIDAFVDERTGLELDDLVKWANFMDVDVEYPPIDDMYPDWEAQLREEVGVAMRKAFDKT